MTTEEFEQLLRVYVRLQLPSPDVCSITAQIETLLCAAHRERVRPVDGEYVGRLECVRRAVQIGADESRDDATALGHAVLLEDRERMREACNEC